jgi:A/G-specific adenine glycosylase
VITEDHAGQVPNDLPRLLALPGVGNYTAAAILSFAYGQRHVVLDTNVRRVLARVLTGVASPGPTTTAPEIVVARSVLPAEPARAARWAVASMELGAVLCTSRAPRCSHCPVRDLCAWRLADYPPWTGPSRKGQRYGGTDRQCRGVLLAVLRSSDTPVSRAELESAWADDTQRERALASLLADGLAVPADADTYSLPR